MDIENEDFQDDEVLQNADPEEGEAIDEETVDPDEPVEGSDEPDGEGDEEGESAEDEEDSFSVDIEDDGAPDDNAAPRWVKDLRKTAKENKRTIRELSAQLQYANSQLQQRQQMPRAPKPTLESCNFNPNKYEQELANWVQYEGQARAQEHAAQQYRNAEFAGWMKKLEQYDEKKSALRVKDFPQTEELARQALSVVQQGIIVQGAENPAMLVYALGKNPHKMAELARIQDPVSFAFAVAKMETKLKVNKRAGAPAPERKVSGTASVTGKTLDRLRKEAERTGDYTKVLDFKRRKNMR